MKHISNIIKDSSYSLSLFDQPLIDELEQGITIKKEKPYIMCAIRDKEIVLKPEEVVRQLYLKKTSQRIRVPQKENQARARHTLWQASQVC